MGKYGFLGTVAVALALVGPQVARAAPTGYSDPSGDNGVAADIGAVTVELGADGFIAVKSAIANLPQFGQAGLVFAAFDTDRNGGTGSIMGGDYLAFFDFADASHGFARWDGSQYVEASGDVTTIVGSGSAEFRVRPAALGGATSFNFSVYAGTGTPESALIDTAPDSGTWFYEVKQVLTVERVNATFVPAAPRAGRVFQAPVVRVTLSDGTSILAPSYRCVAQLGGKLLRGKGRGGCTFTLPMNAKGKRLLVTLFVTYKGVTDEFKPYVFKVR